MTRRAPQSTQQGGFVLLLTLGVLVIISIAAGYFAERVGRAVELATQSRQNAQAEIDMASTRAEILYRLGTTSLTEFGLGAGDTAYRGDGDTLVRIQDTRGLVNLNLVDDMRLSLFLGLLGVESEQRGRLIDTLRDYTDADKLTRINGEDARKVANNHWVVSGDRGITYADALPEGTRVTAGNWWPEGYSGPPQVSFAAEEAAEMGLKLGDQITVNVLGRDIEAQVTSFREVDFSTGGMGFVLTLNKAALVGAPHGHLATVYAPPESEAAILREVSKAFPNVTAISVKTAVARVTEALTAIAQATMLAALATLITGFVVLIGAAAAGERARRYEAAVLKVLGASRGRILASFALRSALMGAAAGLVAIATGALAGWAVLVWVMEVKFTFDLGSALAIVAGGIGATLLAGLLFMLRPLGAKPAGVLRSDG